LPVLLVALGRLLPLSCLAAIYAYNEGYTSAAHAARQLLAAAYNWSCVIRRYGSQELPFSASVRTPWPLPGAAAFPLRCRSAWSAGSAASSREPVQQRCRGSWSEGTGVSR